MVKKRITKQQFLTGFIVATMVLALVRCAFPQIARSTAVAGTTADTIQADTAEVLFTDDVTWAAASPQDSAPQEKAATAMGRFFNGKHPILSVRSFKDEFPDTNALQLQAAEQWGVAPVQNRDDAEERKGELVYIGSNPYYFVKELSASIPYLVPRAAVLLQDIGRNFFDSLQVKQIPLHKIMVTSVLRSKDDVGRLRRYNRNATEQSCHLYGTTFDIGYNHYQTVSNPDGKPRREVQSDTLKYVLSEVLRDLRNQHRCYVKYEVKQGCFHITTR